LIKITQPSEVVNTAQAMRVDGVPVERDGATAGGAVCVSEGQNFDLPGGVEKAGLSLSHISPQAGSVGCEVVITPPQIKYAVCASLVKVSRGGEAVGGGKRGVISGRSAASRRRLLDTLHSVNREAYNGAMFVTLTYPDEVEPIPEKVHRDLDCFSARLGRLYPGAAVIWSQESKPRKSGEHVGKVYYHYHLITFGVTVLDPAWVSRAWFEIVNSGEAKHLAAGTRVEMLRDSKQGIAYVAKYLSKEESAETALPQLLAVASSFSFNVTWMWWQAYVTATTGRTWGAFGRENLPIAFAYAILTDELFYSLRRQLRNYVKGQAKMRGRKVRYRSDYTSGVTAYVSDNTAVRLLMSM
jgi:hypothetical protein